MKRARRLGVRLLLVTSGAVWAQEADQTTILERVRRAIELPRVADEAREVGIPVEDVEAVLTEARRRRVPAAEATDVLEETNEMVREHGPIENFGAFVQSQLEAGLRGRDLAAAIRAEHERRGIGRGRRLPNSMPPGAGRQEDRMRGGPPEGRGPGGAGGPGAAADTTGRRPAQPGRPARPDTSGRRPAAADSARGGRRGNRGGESTGNSSGNSAGTGGDR